MELIAGVIVGAGVVLLVLWLRRRPAEEIAQRLLEQAQAQRVDELGALVQQIKGTFGLLSREALSANSADFLKLAGLKLDEQAKQGQAALEAKKLLIDKSLEQMTTRLTELAGALQTLDKDRRQSHGLLTGKLEQTSNATAALQKTAAQLREALANPQRRGQWGERMADDVLRLAGFMEGVNYYKQSTTESGNKPDFTFPLPRGQRVNMDVKFPLASYVRYQDCADGDPAAQQFKSQFLRDVRSRIREVTTRDYIDTAGGTLDYVLVFIPNEQVYGFIHEHDPALLDDALHEKVVLCSPLTLYAVLSVIRQATEQFRLEETSHQILSLLAAFKKEWAKYTEVLEKMGSRLEDAMKQYEVLSTTRHRQLEKQLDRIEALRSEEQVVLPSTESEG